ncbi:hypothetical protein EV714DRAFT_277105 [Schizophyllum commune]
MDASLAKIPIICSVVWDIYQNLTPPSPPPPPTDRLPNAMLVPGLLEVAVILAGNYPNAPGAAWVLRYLLPPGGLGALQITTPFLVGWALNLAATLLRVHCYHRLDRHFTFELAVQKEQKLVTDGVYGIVRHPSYSATILACIGYSVAQFFPGSWLYEYLGVMPTTALGAGLGTV